MSLLDFKVLCRLALIMFHPDCGAIVINAFHRDTGQAETFGSADADRLAVDVLPAAPARPRLRLVG